MKTIERYIIIEGLKQLLAVQEDGWKMPLNIEQCHVGSIIRITKEEEDEDNWIKKPKAVKVYEGKEEGNRVYLSTPKLYNNIQNGWELGFNDVETLENNLNNGSGWYYFKTIPK